MLLHCVRMYVLCLAKPKQENHVIVLYTKPWEPKLQGCNITALFVSSVP